MINTFFRLGQRYNGVIDIDDFIPSAETIANNVRRLANEYRQAEERCLCIIPDLWSDKHRKNAYIGLTCSFINQNFRQVIIDLCCAEYDEADKSGKSVFLVSLTSMKRFCSHSALFPF